MECRCPRNIVDDRPTDRPNDDRSYSEPSCRHTGSRNESETLFYATKEGDDEAGDERRVESVWRTFLFQGQRLPATQTTMYRRSEQRATNSAINVIRVAVSQTARILGASFCGGNIGSQIGKSCYKKEPPPTANHDSSISFIFYFCQQDKCYRGRLGVWTYPLRGL